MSTSTTHQMLKGAKKAGTDLLNQAIEKAPEAVDSVQGMGTKLRGAVPPSVPTWVLVGGVAIGGYFTYHAVSKVAKTGAQVILGVGAIAVAGRLAKVW